MSKAKPTALLRRSLSCAFAIILAIGLMPVSAAQAEEPEQLTTMAEPQSYSGYTDVQPTDWYVASGDFDYALENGFLRGYAGGTTFGPYDPVTRGQVAVVLWRMAGEPAAGDEAFWDVDYSQYYDKAILWASKNGVINGFGDGSFRPDGSVTREQLATMLANFSKNIAERNIASDCHALNRIAGASQVSNWARQSMSWAVDKGIVSGETVNGTAWVNPQGYAQRCAFAKMVSVEHRDVLGLASGTTVGNQSGVMATYRSYEKVVLDGYLREVWWEHPVQGWQQSFILQLDEPASFNIQEGWGYYHLYENALVAQVYEDEGSLPDSVLNRRVRAAATVGTWIGTIWQRRDVVLEDCTVIPID